MSPVATSSLSGLLEHPAEAFAYYRQQGIKTAICEENYMGSRVVVIVCRDPAVTQKRFGISSGNIGICYTRAGRRFFADAKLPKFGPNKGSVLQAKRLKALPKEEK